MSIIWLSSGLRIHEAIINYILFHIFDGDMALAKPCRHRR